MTQKLVVDCSTGTEKLVALTPQDTQQAQVDAQAAATAAATASATAQQRATDVATLKQKAATDPTFAAIARLLGIQ